MMSEFEHGMEQDLEVLDDMFVLENSLVIFNSF
jgi:hypothetical protein